MPKPNISLLERTLQYIKNHPKEWNQTAWRCETGMCFAGHAATIAGGKWTDTNRFLDPSPYMYANGADTKAGISITNWEREVRGAPCDTLIVWSSFRAQRVLGLTSAQAEMLFDPGNGLDDLERIIEVLKSDPDWNPIRDGWPGDEA